MRTARRQPVTRVPRIGRLAITALAPLAPLRAFTDSTGVLTTIVYNRAVGGDLDDGVLMNSSLDQFTTTMILSSSASNPTIVYSTGQPISIGSVLRVTYNAAVGTLAGLNGVLVKSFDIPCTNNHVS